MIQEHFGTLERCLPLKFGRCACTGMFWTFVGGLESADDELSGREEARLARGEKSEIDTVQSDRNVIR